MESEVLEIQATAQAIRVPKLLGRLMATIQVIRIGKLEDNLVVVIIPV